jgi:hypothetical protein
MTMVDYLRFLPDPPEECRDPTLFRMLNEFHFVRWHPDCQARREELQREIFAEAILRRAEAGTTDPYDRLRIYCGELLIWARRNAAAPFTLALLGDSNHAVRGAIAEILGHLKDDRYIEPLIELARGDASAFVRGCAASGLGGQDPLAAIPVLLGLIDNDHETDATGHSPSSRAAAALDEMMETEWTQKRLGPTLRSLNPAGTDIDALKEQALVYLAHCRQERGV